MHVGTKLVKPRRKCWKRQLSGVLHSKTWLAPHRALDGEAAYSFYPTHSQRGMNHVCTSFGLRSVSTRLLLESRIREFAPNLAREPVRPFALTRQAGRGASGRLSLSLERASPFGKIDGVLRPHQFPLQIVKRTHEPFDGDDWLFEIKHDGFRMLAIRDGGPTRLFTRNGYDFTQRNRPTAAALDRLSAERFVLDGELVMLEHDGRSNFAKLARGRADTHYYAFDLLMLGGANLRRRPLEERKAALAGLLRPRDRRRLRFLRSCALEDMLAQGRFKEQAENLRLYRWIATMDKSAPLPSLRDQTPTWREASALGKEWELNRLVERLDSFAHPKPG